MRSEAGGRPGRICLPRGDEWGFGGLFLKRGMTRSAPKRGRDALNGLNRVKVKGIEEAARF